MNYTLGVVTEARLRQWKAVLYPKKFTVNRLYWAASFYKSFVCLPDERSEETNVAATWIHVEFEFVEVCVSTWTARMSLSNSGMRFRPSPHPEA